VLNTLIGFKSTPTKTIKQVLLGTGHKTPLIGIFYSYNKRAVMFFCKKIVEQHGPDATQVKPTRGTGGKSYPYLFFHSDKDKPTGPNHSGLLCGYLCGACDHIFIKLLLG
jgi:hypothetical protein